LGCGFAVRRRCGEHAFAIHKESICESSSSRFLEFSDPYWIEPLYDLYLTRLSADGSVDETWIKGAIEFTQKSLGGAAKEAPPSQVFDFSFVQKSVR
jgi:hypothetical protein